MADPTPSVNTAVTQATEESQAPSVQETPPTQISESQAPDVSQSHVLAPALTDDELGSLFGDDREPDLEDDDIPAPKEDSVVHIAQGFDEQDFNGMQIPDDELAPHAGTQDLGSIDDLESNQDEFPDFDETMAEVQSQDQYSEELHEEQVNVDAMNGVEAPFQEHNIRPQSQEQGSNMEDIQHSQNRQEGPLVRVPAIPDTPELEDPAPTHQTLIHEINDDEDSLFVPDQRLPSPGPGFSSRPSLTRGLFNRSSATPGPLNILTATPSFAAQPSSSSMLPTPVSASRSPSGPSRSVFNKMRQLQRKFSQDRAAASRPPQLAQPAPDGGTYLDAILSHAPGRQTSAGFSTAGEDNHDRAEREAQAKYQNQRKHYEEVKKKKGKLNFAEDVAWMRIRSEESARLRKRKRDQDIARQENGESDLFPDTFRARNGPDDGQDGDMFDDDPAGSSRIPEPSSRRAFPSMAEAELRSMQVALQANGDKPSKKKKGASISEQAQDMGKGRGRFKGSNFKAFGSASGTPAKAGVRKTMKDKKAAENATRLHHSLMHSDVFRQQASEDAPEQPTFTSKNKASALKELIASVPTEHQKSAKDDTAALLRATKDFDGRGSCKADGNGMWKVRGMPTSLKHYQVMGTAFMRRRENDIREPRGGLMADQMGLGKTLMMLANIVNGQGNNDADCKTTLLVASPALLTQWTREIELHTRCGLSVMRHTAGSRISSNCAFQTFKQHDIILTTYHEVLRSYPKNDPPIECQTAEQKIAWWAKVYEEARGPLHRMMFHRIVLDEAQAIKNHLSRTSLACRALMARHKWALSGTPILNSLTELYSYFKFLGVPYTGSFKIFKHNYADPKEPESIERLLIRLSQFMIRRDHSDMMMNAPILKLPRASQMTHWCEFNSVERSIYEVVRQRFAKRINLASRQNEWEKQYNNALVMLLRLRQLTAHILMLQLVVQDLLEQEDIEKIREVVQQEATEQRGRKGRTILAIRKQLDNLEAEAKKQSANKSTNRSKPSKRPLPYQDDEDLGQRDIEELLDDSQESEDVDRPAHGRSRASGKTFGKTFDFRPYLNSLTSGENWQRVKKKAVCSDCGGAPSDAWLTSCGHILCSSCYDDAAILAAEEERANSTCKGCGSVFTHANEIQQDDDVLANGPMTRAKKRQHSKEVQHIEQQDIAEEWLSLGGEGVLPSAKTIALKAQLLNW
ncbi:uncharacterized protein N0V89_006874 [Didymosphaeria variabile]|uniref:Helicase ATP-binding domain-containing protein n=1 Tax=Didymosphaeria variabile TaxID=1932322 RepID=A0A9W8XJT3_9PLEO|nr:uncharacterized protein N0V89_006874 [Didymosphaeria variabile]KAJ4351531.1 hypothetical protein N0V89_006874 [Didymosphaeria variabile]